jgi:hypothetical protein
MRGPELAGKRQREGGEALVVRCGLAMKAVTEEATAWTAEMAALSGEEVT